MGRTTTAHENWLSVGIHFFNIDWDNTEPNDALCITELKLKFGFDRVDPRTGALIADGFSQLETLRRVLSSATGVTVREL